MYLSYSTRHLKLLLCIGNEEKKVKTFFSGPKIELLIRISVNLPSVNNKHIRMGNHKGVYK